MNIIERALRELERTGYLPVTVSTPDGFDYRPRSVAETLDIIEDYEEALIVLRGREWIKVVPYEKDPEDRIVDWSLDIHDIMEEVLP